MTQSSLPLSALLICISSPQKLVAIDRSISSPKPLLHGSVFSSIFSIIPRCLQRRFKCSLLHLQRRSWRLCSSKSTRLRLRQRRRLLRHSPIRRLLQPQHRQESLRLRRQQLLSAQESNLRQLRLLRLRHNLCNHPNSIYWLRVPIVSQWWYADTNDSDNWNSATSRDILDKVSAAATAIFVRVWATAAVFVCFHGSQWGVDYSTRWQAMALDNHGDMFIKHSNNVFINLMCGVDYVTCL